MFLAGQSDPERKPRISTGTRTLLEAPCQGSISGPRLCFLSAECCYFHTLCQVPYLVEFVKLVEPVLYVVL